jgi:hypothetical protein
MSWIETPGDSSRYDALVDQLQQKFGTKEGLFLANRVAKAIRQCGDGNLSHWRFARASRPIEIMRYEGIRMDGC